MPQAEFATLLFCCPMPFETLYPFFSPSTASPQIDPQHTLVITTSVTHNRNFLIFYFFLIFAHDFCFGLPVKQCSLWKAHSVDLKIPKRVSGCLYIMFIVDHTVSKCLDKAPTFCNFWYSW